jgi:type III secretion system low calcium response chaperone LcrH/SycD
MPTESAALNTDSPLFQELLKHIATENGVLREVKNITEKEMESIYAVAHSFYKAGKSLEAEKFFRFLCFFDHLTQKYWLGLGAACQTGKKYKEAIEAYTFAMMLDSDDPRPPLYAADCHIALGNRTEAESALNAAIHFAGDKPEKKAHKERAEALLKLIQSAPKK